MHVVHHSVVLGTGHEPGQWGEASIEQQLDIAGLSVVEGQLHGRIRGVLQIGPFGGSFGIEAVHQLTIGRAVRRQRER